MVTSQTKSTAPGADNDPQVTSRIYTIVSQLCARDTAASRGYSKPAKPVLVHCIALGPIFSSSSPSQAAGLATLQQIQYLGNVAGKWPALSSKIADFTDEQVNTLREEVKQHFAKDR